MPQLFILYRSIFENLKAIEHHYNVRFSNLNIHSIINSTLNNVALLISAIKGEPIEYNLEGELTMDLPDNSDSTLDQLKNVNELNPSIIWYGKAEEVVELHGQKISLGYKNIELLESFIINLKSIIDKEEQVVRIRSKKKKMLISYSKTAESAKLNQ